MARHVLDCGCVLTDGGRVWCPSCLGPYVSNDIGIRRMQNDITAWANEIFPNRTIESTIRKLVEDELPEFQGRPTDAGEYADLVILILDIAGQQGIDVARAVQNKMQINRKRSWYDTGDGKYQHTEER